ncbi:hypothetical protein ASPZODRAFT_20841 [Penicilliopsis zonata CBS 506.65]|uniref:Peptidase S12 Pab87-related C-terminal domain-containing protein n=1 Tax=Penicilliopsis zonata CBS 506.65 TaxID=1073090 RepID=A0A1L9S4D7_9EURO|nr:hypothetical protein ASPZODRAFT_20841 [Penicilliopsis zonata CBS 506.65]OJJ42032.1 hypothetical protein ASPZODRAFT_20841 [Penicilliopsis zonata CBS 506.65]
MANSTYSSNFGGTCLAYDLIDSKLAIPAGARFDWRQKFVDSNDQMIQYNENAVPYFYPNLPSPPRPGPTLPVEDYTGTYWQDGYGQLDIYLGTDNKLRANRTHCTTDCSLTFENVTGDYFIAKVHVVGAETVVPAEFSLSSDGKPKSVGIGWEPRMGKDRKIWMRKVDDDRGPGPDPAISQEAQIPPYQTSQLPEFLTSHLFM